MSKAAEIRDALQTLTAEATRANALQAAVDVVSEYLTNQPKLEQVRSELAKADSKLQQVTDQITAEQARLVQITAERQSVVDGTKAAAQKVLAEVEADITKARGNLEVVRTEGAQIKAKLQNDIGAKRKELEEVTRAVDQLAQRLAK